MKILSQYQGVNIELMPYVYLPAYASFCRDTNSGDVIFFEATNGNSLACRLWKNKLLTWIQPLYAPLSQDGKRLATDTEKEFLEVFVKAIKTKKIADRIAQSPAFAVFSAVPAGSTKAPFGTYFLDLENNSLAALEKNLHGKHRNVIRHAEKNNIQLKFGSETIKDFHSLYSQTMTRSKMHCEPMAYFEKLLSSLPNNSICAVSYYEQRPQGALLIPYTSFAAFYLYGASAEKIEVNGAMNYLHWATIQKLKHLGVKRYDFVGARIGSKVSSKLQGIQQFKERFGCELEKGFLWKKDISPLKCKAYDQLLALKLGLKKQKVPMDIISQEINNDGSSH